ncbi:M13 family peptidase [Phocaeicola vulgatus]|nr:M13 family peptidase [Phocaeicola vulgatus]RHB56773.1 M13 family peptidase [Phocaeicola vulgatus]
MAVLALAVAAGCDSKKEAVMTSGIDLTNLDTTAVQGADFYQYACGGWMKKHPLTNEYSRFGSFDMLAENNREQLKGLIVEIAAGQNAQGTIGQKIGDIYKLAMDSVKLNADGVTPIQADLEKIASVKDKSEIVPLMAELAHSGVFPYFSFYVGADIMDSKSNLFQLYQGGISLGEKEYYLDNDDVTVNIRNKYKEHIVKMFQLAGFDEAAAKKKMEAVMDIETRIAKASFSAVEQRNPAANYHKMSLDELKKEIPGIDWDAFLNGIGVKGVTELSVSQVDPIKEVEKIINSLPVENQIAYMQWSLIDRAAGYLSDDLVAQNFDFYGKTLSGKQTNQPRWKRAVSTVNGVLGEAVGQMYVEKYFPAAAKERMVQLVKNLQTALGERIRNLEWMGDSTKIKAIEKLNSFYVKVGYPDKWRDYTGLNIEKDSYWANVKRATEFELDYMLSKAGKPVDRDEWGMTPQTVNAYYNPTTNEICFPAGILQYPFFDMNADDAFNYGAIGVVIGHEMTHGFDDQGRQFDKDGNLKDWWTAEDAKRFEERAQVMVNFFDSIQVLPGLNANGSLTLGENIADHGGLQVSFQAFKNATKDAPLPVKDGFTPEQRFFLSYAGVWAGNIRDEQIHLQTKSDPHSLGRWRVNGALPQIGAWYDAFGIKEGDPMYLAPEKRVSIW